MNYIQKQSPASLLQFILRFIRVFYSILYLPSNTPTIFSYHTNAQWAIVIITTAHSLFFHYKFFILSLSIPRILCHQPPTQIHFILRNREEFMLAFHEVFTHGFHHSGCSLLAKDIKPAVLF